MQAFTKVVREHLDQRDFTTITCATWNASGRNFGIGTPGGLILYSVERLFQSAGRPPCPSSESGGGGAQHLEEVCRRVVDGGVGLISLHEQCSVVAVAGVQSLRDASTVSLIDVARPPFSNSSTALDGSKCALDEAQGVGAVPSPVGDSCSIEWQGASAVVASAHFSATVAAVRFSPYFIFVALTGDANIVGSHKLYLFNHKLEQIHMQRLYPPSSNLFLQDLIAIAPLWTPATGAGISIKWLRSMVPGEKRGELRLVTIKRVTPMHHISTARLMPQDPSFVMGERAVHQSSLRAVAISLDGGRGVTMGESGTKLKLLEFLDDDRIVERLTLSRGRFAAMTDSVSLHILSVLRAGALSRDPLDLVVCTTSAGTIHLFLCDTARNSVLHHMDKTLCPQSAGATFAYAASLPHPTLDADSCALFVLQWDHSTNGPAYLSSRENAKSRSEDGDPAAERAVAAGKNSGRLLRFRVNLGWQQNTLGVSSLVSHKGFSSAYVGEYLFPFLHTR